MRICVAPTWCGSLGVAVRAGRRWRASRFALSDSEDDAPNDPCWPSFELGRTKKSRPCRACTRRRRAGASTLCIKHEDQLHGLFPIEQHPLALVCGSRRPGESRSRHRWRNQHTHTFLPLLRGHRARDTFLTALRGGGDHAIDSPVASSPAPEGGGDAEPPVPGEAEPPTTKKRAADAPPPSSLPERRPWALLAVDVETHGWLDSTTRQSNHRGQFGKLRWGNVRDDLGFARVVQIGWCAFAANGDVLERMELCISDAVAARGWRRRGAPEPPCKRGAGAGA